MHSTLSELKNTLTPSEQMPVVFIGHGNPMNAITDNAISQQWRSIGLQIPNPQAFVVISAHWTTQGTEIMAAMQPGMLYDMYGFPEELYRVQYPSPGSPELATLLKQAFVSYEARLDSVRGLDHGVWSVMNHLAPEAHIPVLQISLDMRQSLAQLHEAFQLLRGFRNHGVVFIGSGNIVHNLYAVDFSGTSTYDWALEFDDITEKALHQRNDTALIHPQNQSLFSLAAPTDEHYRPLIAALALLDPTEQLTQFNATIDMGSVGMRSFISNPLP